MVSFLMRRRCLQNSVTNRSLTGFILSLIIHGAICESVCFQNAKSLSRSINDFAFRLYKVVSKENVNSIISPFSVYSALSLAYAGASGVTADQMKRALQFPEDFSALEKGFQEFWTILQGSSEFTDVIGNKVYRQCKCTPTKYQRTARNAFDARIERVKILEREATRKKINSWVELKTQSNVKELINKDDFVPGTQEIALNSLSFLGNWSKTFDEERTANHGFTLRRGKSMFVQVMANHGKTYLYTENNCLKARIMKLYFKGHQLSMLLFIPYDLQGVEHVVNSLNTSVLDWIEQEMAETVINLNLPKFNYDKTTELGESLRKIGLEFAFNSADFIGMCSTGGRLYKVKQKIKMEVNEEGTKAASGTGVFFSNSTSKLGQERKSLKAERAFFFIIQEERTGTILFMGTVRNPIVVYNKE